MQWGIVVIWWVLWLALLGAGLPLASVVFPDTVRRSGFAALPFSLVVLVLSSLWLGQLSYGPATAFLSIVTLAGLSAIALRHGPSIDRRPAIELAAVFTIAFLFLLAIRSVDAGAVHGGGEKFLDFGLVQSLLRAEYLPPADHWWAGERVIYYYGGHLITATLALGTGTPGRFAYNVALVGFYATAVTTVYGFAGALAAHRGFSRQLAGGIAAFLFGYASNLFTAVGVVATYLYPPLLDNLATATGYDPNQVRVTIDAFSYWFASRVIPGTITEFPLFAYLNGDLHAHMTDTGLLLLVAALGYAYYRTPAENLRRRRVLVFGIAPIVIGAVIVVNTWSLPATLGLLWLALTFAPPAPISLVTGQDIDDPSTAIGASIHELRQIVVSLILVIPVAIVAFLWVTPFVGNVLFAGAANRGIGLLPDRSGLVAFLIAHGGFLLIFTWYILGYTPRADTTRLVTGGLIWVVVAIGSFAVGFPAFALVPPLLFGAWYLHRQGLRESLDPGIRPGYESMLLVAGAGLVLIVELIYVRDAASPGRFNTVFKVYAQVWPLWSVAAGVACVGLLRRPLVDRGLAWVPSRQSRRIAVGTLLLGVSLYGVFALIEHFYAYVLVWLDHLPLILGGGAVVVLVGLVLLDVVDSSTWSPSTIFGSFHRTHPILITVIAGLLVFHGGIAVTADAADSPGPDPTIDALAYVHTWHSGEAPAIEWLLDRPDQPYLVAAPGWDVYGWSSEASSLTGLPTVAGWATESIYRGGDAYAERASDVDTLFRGPPVLRAVLLDKYDIRYIYVGPNERARYADANLTFNDEPGITIAYQAPAVTIYAVNESNLTTA